jgi:signal transduction histidine kinase
MTVRRLPNPMHSLSARLLVLTIFFVMVAEVLIYTPSIARFREQWMLDRLTDGYLASLAVVAAPEGYVTRDLEMELLDQTGAVMIDLIQPDEQMYMLGDEEIGPIAETYDLGQQTVVNLILDAFATLMRTDDRLIRIEGPSPRDPGSYVMMVVHEAPLRAAMVDFSWRILGLSIVISLITAGLVFLALRWLLIRPMVRMTEQMVAFRDNPEDADTLAELSSRQDELGTAQRALRDMQTEVRQALRQQSRLAALGTAMTKINHDLRNTLAAASLISERLTQSDDPEVRRLAPKALEALDRAVDLCTQTLAYTREGGAPMKREPLSVGELAEAVRVDLEAWLRDDLAVTVAEGADLTVRADRLQSVRALANLVKNAIEAGATAITITARDAGERVDLTVADNGPGLPPRAREHLFRPFAASARPGGTGLGLAIAREIMLAHRGELVLDETGSTGTVFRMSFPK